MALHHGHALSWSVPWMVIRPCCVFFGICPRVAQDALGICDVHYVHCGVVLGSKALVGTVGFCGRNMSLSGEYATAFAHVLILSQLHPAVIVMADTIWSAAAHVLGRSAWCRRTVPLATAAFPTCAEYVGSASCIVGAQLAFLTVVSIRASHVPARDGTGGCLLRCYHFSPRQRSTGAPPIAEPGLQLHCRRIARVSKL